MNVSVRIPEPHQENFINKVMGCFPEAFYNAENTLLEEILFMKCMIAGMHTHGWLCSDAIAYCKCMEEVNPSLDEDLAISRMARIRSKYKEIF
jgi:hypothetical protein